MPPGVLMAAANTGTKAAITFDIFDVPLGENIVTVREPVCWRELRGGKNPKVEYYRCPHN